jgi:hypothetical protein
MISFIITFEGWGNDLAHCQTPVNTGEVEELIIDLLSGGMPDLLTTVGGKCGAADLQHVTTKDPRLYAGG